MNVYSIGRVFLGISLTGIGILHFFFHGIRPIILPNLSNIPSSLYWTVYLTAIVLIGSGILISIGKRITAVSLIIGICFFLLFLFGHLPSFLSATTRADKLKYWVNLNKTLALSGGFLILASVNMKDTAGEKIKSFFNAVLIVGKCFFALMLLLFGIGHLTSTTSLSALVPKYIPFAKFWTFAGGIILVVSAISIFVNFKVKKIAFILSITLFVWLVTLHLYYTFLFPHWQEGENFIGSLTCLAFCGTALLISRNAKISSTATTNKLNAQAANEAKEQISFQR